MKKIIIRKTEAVKLTSAAHPLYTDPNSCPIVLA